MGYVVCAVTEKGGSGKSTFVTNMAVQWQATGKRVLVLDLDPQRSVATWSQVRSTSEEAIPGVEVAYIEGNTLGKILGNLKDDYDVVWLDVPGADNGLLRMSLMQADLAVIPSTVGGFDFLTSSHTLNLICEAQQLRAELPGMTPLKSAFFLNKTRKGSVGARGLKSHFDDHLQGITLCTSEFGFLDDFWGAAQSGLGVVEFNKKGAAAKQVRALAKEIESIAMEGAS